MTNGPSEPNDPSQQDDWTAPQQPAQPGDPASSTQPLSSQPEVLESGGQAPTGSSAVDVTGSTAGRGAKRGILIGAGVVVVALVAGGVAMAASRLGGGGAQPDEVVPASALGFVSIDLDPAAGQKVDALRFARKFPDAANKIGKDDDLRKALFDSLSKQGDLKGDWATDVEPWLGQRAGLAVLPPRAEGEDPQTVFVVAVTDKGKAKAGIAKVSGGKVTCEVTDEFALCSEDSGVAKKALDDAEKSPLSENKNYAADLDAVGDDGIARTWVDLGKIAEVAPDSAGLGSSLGAPGLVGGGALKGRAAMVLRFDGAALELKGSLTGADVKAFNGKASVGDLPADTVAALGFGGASQGFDELWKQARASMDKAGATAQLDAQLQQLEAGLGIAIPGDISKALGDRVSVVFGGVDQDMPKIALKLSGDAAAVDKLTAAAGQATGSMLTLGTARSGQDSVVASTQAYADAVAKGSGLSASKTFQDAVPGAKDAQSVLYVDIAKVLAQVGGMVPVPDETKKNLEPLSALGATTTRDGDTVGFSLRLTTR